MNEERITSGKYIIETDGDEKTLRPHSFSGFIGQDKLKENLTVFILAAKNRGESWTMSFFPDHPAWEKQHFPG